MDAPSDRKIRALALLLASHTDDLQRLGTSLADRMSREYSSGVGELRGILLDAYADLDDGEKPTTFAYMNSIAKMKAKVMEYRRPRFDSMKAILADELAALEKNEESFSLAWIIALYEAFNLPAPSVKDMSKRASEEIRKYGIYNGESIDAIFDKYLAADVNRLVSAVTIEAGMREKGSIKHLRGEIERALLTARRQMHVNIMMIVNGVSNETSSAVARKNSKYVDAVMWATELDERVCEECDALEGEIFLPDEAPACPMHPNCRCRLVPVMREMTPYLVEEIEG